jgi:outer membrane protein
MRNVSRVLLAMGAVLLMVTAFAGTVTAQTKIGYIDDERIKNEFKDWQRAQDQWRIEQKAWEDEAVAKQTELEDMLEEYDKQRLILSEEKKQEREAAIRAKRDALDAYTKTL